MQPENTVSKNSRITGWILSILVILFCLFDAFGKLVKPDAVIKGTMDMGYPERMITPIGVILLAFTILYAIPKTALLGAVLLTGYLGGAAASTIRIEAPLFSHILFPVYFAIIAWAGLYLRSGKLRRVFRNEPLNN